MLQIDDVILHENSATRMPVADSLEEVEQVHILRVLQNMSWVIREKRERLSGSWQSPRRIESISGPSADGQTITLDCPGLAYRILPYRGDPGDVGEGHGPFPCLELP